MRLIRAACAALASLTIAVSASAQQSAANDTSSLGKIRVSLAGEIESEGGAHPNLQDDLEYVALIARQSGTLLRILQQYEEERSDKQVGATSSASGTTTLVSKGTVPKVLGLAVENGAATRTVNGTTVTFRSDLGGAIRALAGKGFFQLTPGADPSLSLLRRLSASASFDTSRGQTETLTADQQQLSQWTARLQVIDQRDPYGPSAAARWRDRLVSIQTGIPEAAIKLFATFDTDPVVKMWLQATQDAVTAAKVAASAKSVTERAIDIATTLRDRESSFPTADQLRPETVLALDQYERTTSTFVRERHDMLQALATGALVSLEYTNDRPLKAPRTSNVRLVGEVGGTVDLTGNASVTFFDQNPAGVSSSVRDVQFSGQMDIKMGSADTVGAFVLSFAGRYSRQLENSFNDDGVMLPNTKGTTAVGQLKLTVPVKGSGVRIPLSVTFANRTELITESVVRANVGLTYDLDVLFAKFHP
ncbi:MAG: hypothetical protein DMF87_26620 [Acidobacteria bacterium]|nr:MAG: hypothetical protein DMF87_26620 [Acidobacteriota bacterium]